ncbi:MAG: hypothetical protein RB191_21560 [Terriglobia bacterium]|nr:hypothetical protein [Terriglobia bacterium]
MEIISAAAFLDTLGLKPPSLAALHEGADNYRALLFQPVARIEASAVGVRNSDRALALAQFEGFLRLAAATKADMAVTPEYSLPWEVLLSVLKAKIAPPKGAIWVLGCESITQAELLALQAEHKDTVALHFETLAEEADKFLDPLVYVFEAVAKDTAKPILVALVQFKTSPMGDKKHFERSNLQTGKSVYLFGDAGKENHLVGILCSDAFALSGEIAKEIYSRALVVHIQLNEAPRQSQYRQYRERLFNFKEDETEVLCLNWAGNACEIEDKKEKNWKNNSCSAWYVKSGDFDHSDETIAKNHKLGLYYTWLEPSRVHAMFLNFEPAVFLVEATKVAHRKVIASQSNRRGPQLRQTYGWVPAKAAWSLRDAVSDGFAEISKHAGKAESDVTSICKTNPIAAERALALSAGAIRRQREWHDVAKLDSCVLDATEIIRRITFCQDNDDTAAQFRVARLRRCGTLWTILATDAELPKSMVDMKAGFKLSWDPAKPHCNVMSTSGEPATLIYMGEDIAPDQCDAVFTFLAEQLRAHPVANEDDTLRARQRLAVWYRDNGQLRCIGPERFVKIDKEANASPVDITRAE